MKRDYYNLQHGGPADHALPVVVRRIRDIGDQTQETADRVMQMRVAMQITDARTRDLEWDFYPMERLVEDLAISRAEVREYQERHTALEERVRVTERRLAELQGASTSSSTPPEPTRHV